MKINKLQRGIIPLLLSLATLPLWAQVGEQRNNLSIGVNGGVNYNNVTFEPKVKQNGMMAFNGGLTVRYISEKYFAMICGVQLEFNYSQRGWDEKIEDGTNNTYTRTMNYLEVPFLAHLAFGRDRGPQFFLNLGPQVAFLLSESEKMSDGWNPEGRISAQYGKMAENNFDYGITGGAGMEVKTRAGNFLVEGRYYFGLADFYGTSKKDYFGRAAHSIITAKVTYLFDLRK